MERRTIIKNILLPRLEKDGEFSFQEGYLLIQKNVIEEIDYKPWHGKEHFRDIVIDGTNKIALPGFVNMHHHMYQTLTRCYPPVINAELFPWLKGLYPIWANIDEEAVYLATLIACAELMLSGCTTAVDHHYLFPNNNNNLIDVQLEAAKEIGMRFCACRGSMNLSQKDGGLPPDNVVQDIDTILADSERLIDKYHSNEFGSMSMITLAPCSPFSVEKKVMIESAKLAESKKTTLHTHLCETKDEENYCLEKYGKRPVDLLEEVGWLNDKTWLAHGIYFNSEEIERLGKHGVGVAHCPSSNMRLGSGICKVKELQSKGSPVGLAVDGSASNDSSNMLNELRQALFLTRVKHGASSITCSDVLKMATTEGARCLNRKDIGTLEKKMVADIAIFDLNKLDYSGAHDPLGALIICHPNPVHTLIIDGKIQIQNGHFLNFPVELYVERHRNKAKEIVGA